MKEQLESITQGDLEAFRKVMRMLPGVSSEPSVTLQTFVKEDEEYVKFNLGDKYLTSIKLTYKHLLKYFSPARMINTVTIKDAEMFVRSIKKNAPSGYQVYLRNIRAGFNRANTWGYLKENVFAKVKVEKKQINRPAVINEAELEMICGHIQNKTIAAAIRFDFYTGLRAGELINLKWENINLEKRMVTVGDHSFTTKGKKQRFVPLCEKAVQVLELLRGEAPPRLSKAEPPLLINKEGKKPKGYVFAKGNGFQYTTDFISKNFKKAARAAGIDERIHLHSVRASFATYLAEKGANAFQLKELLGHSSVTVTQIYTAVSLETLRQAIEKFN